MPPVRLRAKPRGRALVGVVVLLSASLVSAQEAGVNWETRFHQLEARLAATTRDANNAWVLVSAALVLFMTAPGLAMFYAGLVRRKNVLNIIMQCLFLMGAMTLLWSVLGYSLAFGGSSNPYLGNFDHLLLRGVGISWSGSAPEPAWYVPAAASKPTLPLLTHMLFQGMFFIITPALICGAFAERMRFGTMVVFSCLWGLFVYCPLCHWVWDRGLLAYGSPAALQGGALDFAGGVVVHVSSGVSALICALVIGRRLGFGSEPMPPHNLTYTTLGAAMLWVGWFGFNAGSQLAADAWASSAFAATHLSAAAGAVTWAGIEWWHRQKPSVLGTSSGAVAGLVGITPAAGFVGSMSAIVMGSVAAVACYLACTKLKRRFGYDDALDVFGIHGVGGTVGALLTGVFATRAVVHQEYNGTGGPVGLGDGNWNLILGQLTAVGVTWIFSGVVTLLLLKVLDSTLGLRVTQEQEVSGLDFSQHGEEGYIQV